MTILDQDGHMAKRHRMPVFLRGFAEGLIWSAPLFIGLTIFTYIGGNLRFESQRPTFVRAMMDASPIALIWGISAGVVAAARGKGITSKRAKRGK